MAPPGIGRLNLDQAERLTRTDADTIRHQIRYVEPVVAEQFGRDPPGPDSGAGSRRSGGGQPGPRRPDTAAPGGADAAELTDVDNAVTPARRKHRGSRTSLGGTAEASGRRTRRSKSATSQSKPADVTASFVAPDAKDGVDVSECSSTASQQRARDLAAQVRIADQAAHTVRTNGMRSLPAMQHPGRG